MPFRTRRRDVVPDRSASLVRPALSSPGRTALPGLPRALGNQAAQRLLGSGLLPLARNGALAAGEETTGGGAVPAATGNPCKPLFPPVRKHGGTFFLCGLPTNEFHDGPPEVGPHLTPQMVLKDIPVSSILFDSGAGKMAWDVEANVQAILPDDVPDDSWEIGFIQTVESLTFDAAHTVGWSAQRVVPQASRDAQPTSTTAPWFNPAGSNSGPVQFGTTTANLRDRPMALFPIALPVVRGDKKTVPCGHILSIGCSGVFHSWIVVRPLHLPLSVENLVFLAHTTIQISQIGERDPKRDPKEPTAWTSRKGGGKHERAAFRAGQGPRTPVLNSPVANDFIRHLLVFPGQPCPVGL